MRPRLFFAIEYRDTVHDLCLAVALAPEGTVNARFFVTGANGEKLSSEKSSLSPSSSNLSQCAFSPLSSFLSLTVPHRSATEWTTSAESSSQAL